MATPKDTVWPLDPHTQAKHLIISEYLKAWYPICAGGQFKEFTYAEGFAGPGVYVGEEPGSPVVALDVFLRRRELLRPGQHLNVLLIEERGDRLEELRRQVDRKFDEYGGRPSQLTVTFRKGECTTALLPTLQKLTPRRSPFFAVLDGWGGPDAIPLDIARSAANRPGGEVLVTFQPQHLVRFATTENGAQAGDRCFGSDDWRAVVDQPKKMKKKFLVDCYRNSLFKAGFRYAASFEMRDEKKNELHLVFASNHLKGLTKMKEAMWKVDKQHGVRFRDPRDPDQLEFYFEEKPELSPLRRALLNKLEEGPGEVSELREFALCETVYRDVHAGMVLKDLLKVGTIESSTGKRVPRKQDRVWLTKKEPTPPPLSPEPLF
ncbi:three-Cys-motif partner protein TcmP [Nocardiopsis sp. NPDC058789]|uniref:three-Cys-motif partner protein TcmP n=1 Tax=Nocardiopsis sp. NPDC058789 TaxID=3346634 RepID=UPI00366E639A